MRGALPVGPRAALLRERVNAADFPKAKLPAHRFAAMRVTEARWLGEVDFEIQIYRG